jgi:hypothetical protein
MAKSKSRKRARGAKGSGTRENGVVPSSRPPNASSSRPPQPAQQEEPASAATVVVAAVDVAVELPKSVSKIAAQPEVAPDPFAAAHASVQKIGVATARTSLDTAPPVVSDAESHPEHHPEHSDFFTKSEAEVHAEEAAREAPEFHDLDTPSRRRTVDHRARRLAIGIVAFAGVIGLAGAFLRRGTPPPIAASAAVAAPLEAPVETARETPSPEPAVILPPAEAPAMSAATAESLAPSASAAVAPEPEPAPEVPSAAPSAASAAPAAPSASAQAADPSADPDDAFTGPQLAAQARAAINRNDAKRAAELAKKAIAKGAGGSVHYVLGAAYQTMGARGAAKAAYSTCARSKAPEAAECASLADAM